MSITGDMQRWPRLLWAVPSNSGTSTFRYPGGDLLSYLHHCNERGVTAVVGEMRDRVAPGGMLAKVL